MPRTKKVQASKRLETKKDNTTEIFLKKLDDEEKIAMELLDAQMEKELQVLSMCYMKVKTKYPRHILDKPIKDIETGALDMALNSTKSSTKSNQTIHSSRTLSKRSISLGYEDEGYTTAESTRGTTSGDRTTRQSRSRNKTSAKPISRSLSRTTTKKVPTYKTPINKQPSNKEFGSITPKCKPNTPQLIVRRPKLGEVAWSNQGSPLLTTNTVAADHEANVNIPLPDGNVVSLLPQRGIRVSQIPSIDYDTRRQLEILRDNLIKVCSEYKLDNSK